MTAPLQLPEPQVRQGRRDDRAEREGLDGYFAPAVDNTTGDLFKGDTALQRSYTPLSTVRERRPYGLRFYLVVGDADAASRADAKRFAAAVTKPDAVIIVDVPGRHNRDTWTSALPGALAWLALP